LSVCESNDTLPRAPFAVYCMNIFLSLNIWVIVMCISFPYTVLTQSRK
jgi:hypothetical protein